MPLREREDIMMNKTRRLAPAIAVLAAVGMLTGCSGKGGESGNNKVDTLRKPKALRKTPPPGKQKRACGQWRQIRDRWRFP